MLRVTEDLSLDQVPVSCFRFRSMKLELLEEESRASKLRFRDLSHSEVGRAQLDSPVNVSSFHRWLCQWDAHPQTDVGSQEKERLMKPAGRFATQQEAYSAPERDRPGPCTEGSQPGQSTTGSRSV